VANWIVLVRHVLVVHIGLPMTAEVCSRNLAGEQVVRIQTQEAEVEVAADILVPLRAIVVAPRIGIPGEEEWGGAVVYIRDVCLQAEAGVAHIRLETYEGACIRFRHVELLIALVVYIPVVYGERQRAGAHIHPLASQGAHIHFLGD
jgi:hypothetical protein